MSAEQVARDHYTTRQGLSRLVAELAREVWSRLDPSDMDRSWAGLLPGLLAGMSGAQVLAARAADPYTDRVVAEQGADPAAAGDVVPGSLAGIASDGRPLDTLLLNPITVVKMGIAGGATIDQAMAAGYANLDMLTRTQVADAGRAADQVAIVARPVVTGYVRMLVGDPCSRCVILAGRRYAVNDGFARHPSCMCVHIPAVEDRADDARTDPLAYFDSLTAEEQNKAFGKAGAEAIRLGANPAKVVNARRGMRTATVHGRQVLATTEAAGRRVRLMPETIMADAKDRDDAVRLLKRFGYLRDGAKPRTPATRPQPARNPIEGIRLDLLLDGELFALWNEHPDDPGVYDRIGAELDRRDQARDPDTGDPEELRPADADELLAELDAEREPAVDQQAADKAARELQVDLLVDGGMTFTEAYAQVYADVQDDGPSGDDLRLAEQQSAVDVERRAGETREQTVRRMYEEWVYLRYMDAEQATRGHLLTRAAEARGVDPVDLFSGPAHVARANASEDLKRWWADNGGRKTYTEFRAEILGRASDIEAANKLAGPANDRDFEL